jgi:hypothetical protein
MSNKNVSLRTWIQNYKRGLYNSRDRHVQIEAGWYDWFCRDTSLAGKTRALASKVIRIAGSEKVNMDTMYVFFKNNCPFNGNLYDDFRICDLETGDVIWTIIPSSGHARVKGQAELWGRANDFKGPIMVGTWKDITKYFGV